MVTKKEEAKKRIMGAFFEDDPVAPTPAPAPVPPVAKAAAPQAPGRAEARARAASEERERAGRDEDGHEPPAETPAPLGVLSKVEGRGQALSTDPNMVLKGLYYERSVVQDLVEFSAMVNRDPSRIANAIIKTALAEDTTLEDFRPFLKKMLDRRK